VSLCVLLHVSHLLCGLFIQRWQKQRTYQGPGQWSQAPSIILLVALCPERPRGRRCTFSSRLTLASREAWTEAIAGYFQMVPPLAHVYRWNRCRSGCRNTAAIGVATHSPGHVIHSFNNNQHDLIQVAEEKACDCMCESSGIYQ